MAYRKRRRYGSKRYSKKRKGGKRYRKVRISRGGMRL